MRGKEGVYLLVVMPFAMRESETAPFICSCSF